ncbi:MAG: 3'-5' exonuclease [Desulfobacterales bacterium]|nr:3'-5' exonuclease [Desulfobacterales bacterium]
MIAGAERAPAAGGDGSDPRPAAGDDRLRPDSHRRHGADGEPSGGRSRCCNPTSSTCAGPSPASDRPSELILDIPDLPPRQARRVPPHHSPRGPRPPVTATDACWLRICRLHPTARPAGAHAGAGLSRGGPPTKPATDRSSCCRWNRLKMRSGSAWTATSMALALVFILERLGAELGHRRVRGAGWRAKDRFVGMDFIWSGPSAALGDAAPLGAAAGCRLRTKALRSTLKEILTRHRAELWSQSLAEHLASACLRLSAGVGGAGRSRSSPGGRRVLATARPVYYDFDLFNQPGQSFELDDRLLAGLAYTVFDTETTGLEPAAGDEIVAIGAVRIVNGRLLESECFEQLVKPECSLRQESIRIHGIQPEMLEGQPDVRQVLPSFQRFAEGTVLVAHNAAFDMRLLQLQGERTGIRFEQPRARHHAALRGRPSGAPPPQPGGDRRAIGRHHREPSHGAGRRYGGGGNLPQAAAVARGGGYPHFQAGDARHPVTRMMRG